MQHYQTISLHARKWSSFLSARPAFLTKKRTCWIKFAFCMWNIYSVFVFCKLLHYEPLVWIIFVSICFGIFLCVGNFRLTEWVKEWAGWQGALSHVNKNSYFFLFSKLFFFKCLSLFLCAPPSCPFSARSLLHSLVCTFFFLFLLLSPSSLLSSLLLGLSDPLYSNSLSIFRPQISPVPEQWRKGVKQLGKMNEGSWKQ